MHKNSQKQAFSWGKLVEKAGRTFAQTFNLNTSSTVGLLEISQTTTHVRFLNPAYPQAGRSFTQLLLFIFNLLGGYFYSLSPMHNATNELNKGLLI